VTSRGDQPEPSPVTVRVARETDLDQAARIKAAGDLDMNQRVHPLLASGSRDEEESVRSSRSNLATLLSENPDQVWVADGDSGVIGVTSAAFRGRSAHIQSFFVAPEEQGRGVGLRLLDRLLAAGRDAGCTIFSLQSSDDPRAFTLYLRRGFQPQPPNVVWAVGKPRFRDQELVNPFEATPISPDDPATMNTVGDIDKAVRGAKRPSDLVRWLDEGATGSLLRDRETSKPVGYFLAGMKGSHLRIGPIAAIDEPVFPDVLGAAFDHATRVGSGSGWSMALPGENRVAVDILLSAGFRPLFLLPFFSTAPIGQFDRYAFRDLDFL
jgi:GNAT superfamily N-acetyltransferase